MSPGFAAPQVSEEIEGKIRKLAADSHAASDRFLVLLIWGHVPVATLVISYGYGTWLLGLVGGLIGAGIAQFAYAFAKGTLFSRSVIATVLMFFSSLFITLQLGRIEMHFHIFGALAFLVIYRDWRVLVPAVVYVLLHHGGVNYCQENDISFAGIDIAAFNYDSGWAIVILHAAFVVFEVSILTYYCIYLRREFEKTNRMIFNLERQEQQQAQLIERIRSTSKRILGTSVSLTGVAGTTTDQSRTNAASLEQMAATVEEVQAGIERITGNTNEQTTAVHSIVEATRDLTLRTDSILEQVEQSSGLVNEATQNARAGETTLHSMVDSMSKVAQGTQRVRQVVGIIQGIADRVNLLSLNASIEAARAGAAGRGFAVVANEVSRLADQTATSVTEINDLMQANDKEIQAGMENVDAGALKIETMIRDINPVSDFFQSLRFELLNLKNSFGVIVEKLEKSGAAAQETESAVKEQSTAAKEIAATINHINESMSTSMQAIESLYVVVKENEEAARALSDGFVEEKPNP
ncbi:MAG: methyl-accepting chemotaxis protein [Leptospirales bacterium]